MFDPPYVPISAIPSSFAYFIPLNREMKMLETNIGTRNRRSRTANEREWGISSMEALHAKGANREIDRKMAGQENAITFIGSRKQAVGCGPFPTVDAGAAFGNEKTTPDP
jgi:hypothetical protein